MASYDDDYVYQEGTSFATANESFNTTGNFTHIDTLSTEDYLNEIEVFLAPHPGEWILIACYTVVFVVGLVGNLLVCKVVLRTAHMRTVTNVFLVNLAIGDVLVIMVCLPATLVEDIRETWYLGEVMCKGIKLMQTTSVTVSILTLSVIALERWYAICFPMRIKATNSRAVVLICIIWAVAFAVGSPRIGLMFTEAGPVPGYDILTACKSWRGASAKVWQICEFGILFLVPLVWMSVAYAMIAHRLWSATIPGDTDDSQRTITSRATANQRSISRTVRARRRTALMLISIVVMFFVCYLPIQIILIFDVTGYFVELAKVLGDTVTQMFIFWSHWLCYFNSAVNPIIYNLMSSTFRRSFERACLCRKAEVPAYVHRTVVSSGPYNRVSRRCVERSPITPRHENIALKECLLPSEQSTSKSS